MSLKNKLNRLKPHLSIEQAKENSPISSGEKKIVENNGTISYQNEWLKENVTPYYFDGDYCLVREMIYSLDEQYGKYRFADFIKAVHAWNQTSVSHPLSSKGFNPEDLFFFDTETTGLGGGTGNTIFLLGHASIKENHVVLRQHILPRPGSEVPLYQSFLENIDYSTLVTYNGKAFDWPQVKTRHTLIREHVPRLPSFGHFDLFHASRRLWKHKLERMKLSIVEKEVLGIERKDDVPGFLAPMIYFDFVERQNPEGMIGILKHNEMDILSLITLYTHLTFQLLAIDEQQTSKETFEVGRWYSYIGETTTATKVFSQISNGSDHESLKAKLALSMEWKKQKKWEQARMLWEEISDSNNNTIALEACIELAKWYEHKEKDYVQAILYSEKGRKLLEERMKLVREKEPKELAQLNKRLDRLTRKLQKQPFRRM